MPSAFPPSLKQAPLPLAKTWAAFVHLQASQWTGQDTIVAMQHGGLLAVALQLGHKIYIFQNEIPECGGSR